MAEYPDVVSQALETVTKAQNYLINREYQSTDAAEQHQITEWNAILTDLFGLLIAASASGPPDTRLPMKDVADELTSTRNRLGNLHEYSAFSDVDAVLRGLTGQVQMLAGPHGPGGGRPGGGPAKTNL